jgi:hypothetical protein
MALSGTYTLTRTALDIYQEVLEILQVIGDGETITQSMKDKITPTMNNMLKAWEGQGIHLWTDQEGTLFLQVGQSEYDFTGAVNISNEWFDTTVTVAAVATATTITVASAASIQAGDQIGILDNTNNLFWTTVNGAPVGDVVTITDPLLTDIAVGTCVYNYRDTFIPVRRILNVRRKEGSSYEIPIAFESREDYFNLPNKEARGTPIQAYYSRQEPQGIMYLWNTPSSAVPVINFSYERETQIITQDTDNFDMPSYWFEALTYNIASRVKLKFGTNQALSMEVKEMAINSLDEALSFDNAVYPITVKVEQYG